MLIAEEQAKLMQCCVAVENGCAGSRCMGWRWGVAPPEEKKNYHNSKDELVPEFVHGARVYPDGWQYKFTSVDRNGKRYDLLFRDAGQSAPKHGYCGRAGNPEGA